MEHINLRAENVTVVYPGVDVTSVRREPAECRELLSKRYGITGSFLLNVGTVSPRKNIPTLLRAFAQVSRHVSDITLAIVGRLGWKYRQVTQTLDELDLQKRVIFIGSVPDEDLPMFYTAATMLVYPSVYEGFGLPPLEAMACGCPVVTGDTSSMPEVVGDAGILVDAHDDTAVASAILRVGADEGLRRRMSEKGKLRAAAFSWEKTAIKTIEVYEGMR